MTKISQSIFGVLGAVRFKDLVDFMKPKRSARPKTPAMSQKQYQTTTLLVQNRTVCTIQPLGDQPKIHMEVGLQAQREDRPQVHIVYFHGGGYSMEASGLHFALMKTLVKQTGCALSYVDYPLAPEHTAPETIAMSLEAYQVLNEAYPTHKFLLMGDSAGGGLALALAMKIRDEARTNPGLNQPAQIILFSPWLDIGLSNKRIVEYEKRDVILDAEALREIGDKYRGEIPADHYLVSPKFGDLTGVGPVSIFYGTEEILYPDCVAFCEEQTRAGFAVTGYEYENMQHDWVILPIEEAKKAIGEVCALI